MIRIALSLHYASKSAYAFLASSGFLSLFTLCDYAHWCTIKNGIHLLYIRELRWETASFTEQEQVFCLIIYEMKIKSGIVFNKNSGDKVG